MPASPELLLSLSPSTLRSLLATFAPAHPSLSPKSSPEAVTRALFTSSLSSKKLTAALSGPLSRFSPRPGRTALHEAALALADDALAARILTTPCADVAALFAIELAKTPKPSKRRTLRRLFALATHRVERDLPERPTYELVADASPSPLTEKSALKLLSAALAPRLVDAWSTPDPDGSLRLALFLKQPTENRLVYDETAKRIVQRRDVPVAVDLVRITPPSAALSSEHAVTRVAITTASPELLPLYASALSLSLRPSFTLRPLSHLTRGTLDHVARSTRGVSRIDVVAIRFRRPDGERVEVRAPDALAASALWPRTGYIDRVTIRFILDAGTTVDAFLHLPHRVEISDRAHEAPVRAALHALGLFTPGALPDDARSLAPYVHGEWRWRAVLGDAGFERLVRAKLLVRTQASHVSSEEHRMHGAAYVVRDVPGEPDVQYALAEDRSLGARLVTGKDRVAWRLDLPALAAAMTRDLGSQPAATALDLPGVLDLGVVTLPSGKLRIVYAMAEPPAGWLEALRRACGAAMTPVVLVPKGHAGEAKGMTEVELAVDEQLGAKRIGRVLGKVAEAVGLENEVQAWRRCDEEVVLDLEAQRMWADGVAIHLSDKSWRYVDYLAKSGGKAVTTKEIGSYVSRSEYPDVSARKARAAVERQMKRELAAAGAGTGVADRLFASEGRLGVRFGIAVRVIGSKSNAIQTAV